MSDVPLAVPVRLELGTNPLVEYVPALEAAATEVVADHQRLAAMPVTVPAAELGSLAVVGDREAARALVRALVCQLATWHAPDDLRLVGWFEPSAEAAWSWMKWLPHARETGTVAGAVVELGADGRGDYTELAPGGRREHGLTPDAAPVELCEALARAMAPLVLRAAGGRSATVDSKGLLDLLGLDGAGPLDQAGRRATRSGSELLRTPIGIGDDGRPVHLDLKEAAEHGMGPHGLVVGATGSGKSELLRTLVTGLALGHAPEELALVLVDYKRGATFAEVAGLPHVAGVITNLEREPTLVDRMHEALFGELERRQRVLAEAGNFDRVRDYQAHRAANPEAGLVPLPTCSTWPPPVCTTASTWWWRPTAGATCAWRFATTSAAAWNCASTTRSSRRSAAMQPPPCRPTRRDADSPGPGMFSRPPCPAPTGWPTSAASRSA